jgi:hypothetical protein
MPLPSSCGAAATLFLAQSDMWPDRLTRVLTRRWRPERTSRAVSLILQFADEIFGRSRPNSPPMGRIYARAVADAPETKRTPPAFAGREFA